MNKEQAIKELEELNNKINSFIEENIEQFKKKFNCECFILSINDTKEHEHVRLVAVIEAIKLQEP